MIRRMIRAQWIYCDLLTRGKDNWTMYVKEQLEYLYELYKLVNYREYYTFKS